MSAIMESPTKTPLRTTRRVFTAPSSAVKRKKVERPPQSAVKTTTVPNKSIKSKSSHKNLKNKESHEEISLVKQDETQFSARLEREAQLLTEVESLKAQLVGRDAEIESLKNTVRACQEKLVEEKNSQEQFALKLTGDMHQLYTEKHTAKIRAMRQKYERDLKAANSGVEQLRNQELQEKNNELIEETSRLHYEMDQLVVQVRELQDMVASERTEKEELVSAYDQYFQLQQHGSSDDMSSAER